MLWTPENAGQRDLGSLSSYVNTAGRAFLSQHLNGDGRRLADLFCWAGRNLPVLSDLAGQEGRVIGVDHPNASSAVAKARGTFPGVDFREGIFSRLPLADAELNGALCWRALHNAASQVELKTVLREILRVLAPGAPLLVAVRAMTGDSEHLVRRLRGEGGDGQHRDWHFSRRCCQEVFTTAGFQVVRIAETTESAMVCGQEVTNIYWAVHLLKRY